MKPTKARKPRRMWAFYYHDRIECEFHAISEGIPVLVIPIDEASVEALERALANAISRAQGHSKSVVTFGDLIICRAVTEVLGITPKRRKGGK